MSIASTAVGFAGPDVPALRWPRRVTAMLRLRRYPARRRRRARLLMRWIEDYARHLTREA